MRFLITGSGLNSADEKHLVLGSKDPFPGADAKAISAAEKSSALNSISSYKE